MDFLKAVGRMNLKCQPFPSISPAFASLQSLMFEFGRYPL
jgi:hypothetical protein